MEKWNIRKRDEVFRNSFFNVKKLDCYLEKKGVQNDFYIIDTFDWVNIIALTTEDRFILVRQHRLGTDTLSLETPGGVIDDGEDPEDCAVRELREETGYTGRSVHKLKSLQVNPAIMGNRITFYFIDGCELSSSQDLDDSEDIEVVTVTVDELAEMVRNGKFEHSIAVTGLALFFLSEHNRFGKVEL